MALVELLRRGVLGDGETLLIRRRSAPAIEGVLRPDGTIRVGRTISRTPSAAAAAALGGGRMDGWLRWRVARYGDKSLAELREQL